MISKTKHRKITLQQLARSARVSVATASRAVNGTGRVSPELAERLRKAALKLGFDAHRRTETRLIAFLLGNRDLLHPFHSRILAGAESYCAERDYNILFLSLHYPANPDWKELQVPRLLRRRDLIDGFILAGVHSQNLLDLLTDTGLPFAVQGNSVLPPWREREYDTVWYDGFDSAYEMTRYLQAQGHRDVWFVANRRLPWFERCYEGYQQAMTEAGLRPHSSGPDSENPREVGYLATKSILASGEPLTAIFAGSDAAAVGVYEALRACHRRVPQEISVAGLDDIEAATMHPRLTTVHVFLEQLGRQLAEFVLNRIACPESHAQNAVIATRLIKRESTGPVPRGEVHHETANRQPADGTGPIGTR